MLVLEEQRAHAVHDAGHTPVDRGAVMTGLEAEPAGFDADEPGVRVDEPGERADRVRPAADARDDEVGIGAVENRARTARALRRRRHAGTRAPSTGTDAGPSPSRGSSACPSTVATHSRIASLTASFSVALPDRTGTTSAPSSRMRHTLSAWRSTSTAPMYTVQSSPNSAAAVAVATPC